LIRFHIQAATQFDLHYTVVDDGSQNASEIDTSIFSLREAGLTVALIRYEPNRGKGHALRKGIAGSKASYFLYTDIDFPFTNESVSRILSALQLGEFDVIAGFRSAGYYAHKMSAFRRLLSKAFRFFIRRVMRFPVSDTQCGLKAFNEKGRELFLKTTINRYLFDFEFIFLTTKSKAVRAGSMEVELKQDVVFRKMKLNILIHESLNLFRILLRKPGKRS
jgi:glycosyltransferase involved in cell wall biosynthesis